MSGRQDVVGGAPRGVGDASLGHLLDDRERRGRGEREGHDPQTEPAEVDDRQEERGPGDPEPPVEPVGEPERDHERDPGDGRRDDAEDAGEFGFVRVGRPRRPEVRERHREEEDRQQHVGDGDEAEERRLADLVEADTDVRHDRAAGRPLRHPARADVPARESRDHDGGRGEEDALDADERRSPDRPGDRAGEEAADEVAGDGRGGADREEPAGLADVERGGRDGPGDGRGDRARRHDRQPRDGTTSGTAASEQEFDQQEPTDGDGSVIPNRRALAMRPSAAP